MENITKFPVTMTPDEFARKAASLRQRLRDILSAPDMGASFFRDHFEVIEHSTVKAVMEDMPPDTYRACALAALQGCSDHFKTNFPRRAYGRASWYADKLTKAIFEDHPSTFDPYADKAFCDEAAAICWHYVARYAFPDELPKHSDYSPDQFAACFTNNGALILHKRGCDFRQDDQERQFSDLDNHRHFIEYANKDGQYICGDVWCGREHKPKLGKNPFHIAFDLQQEKENGTFCYRIAGYEYATAGAYTIDNVLAYINADALIPYDRIEIVS